MPTPNIRRGDSVSQFLINGNTIIDNSIPDDTDASYNWEADLARFTNVAFTSTDFDSDFAMFDGTATGPGNLRSLEKSQRQQTQGIQESGRSRPSPSGLSEDLNFITEAEYAYAGPSPFNIPSGSGTPAQSSNSQPDFGYPFSPANSMGNPLAQSSAMSSSNVSLHETKMSRITSTHLSSNLQRPGSSSGTTTPTSQRPLKSISAFPSVGPTSVPFSETLLAAKEPSAPFLDHAFSARSDQTQGATKPSSNTSISPPTRMLTASNDQFDDEAKSAPNHLPLDMDEAARQAAEEDKRRRNTAASARFRVKKKQREQALEKTADNLKGHVAELEERIKQLETENTWLKSLVVVKKE